MIDKKENGIVAGAQVLYVLPNGKVRPAVIVNALEDTALENGEANLQVFTDFTNDELNPVEWRTSVPYSADPKPGTYSFADEHEVVQPEAKTTDEESTSTETAAETTASTDTETTSTETADADKTGDTEAAA